MAAGEHFVEQNGALFYFVNVEVSVYVRRLPPFQFNSNVQNFNLILFNLIQVSEFCPKSQEISPKIISPKLKRRPKFLFLMCTTQVNIALRELRLLRLRIPLLFIFDSLSGVIVRVSVVLKRTVEDGD